MRALNTIIVITTILHSTSANLRAVGFVVTVAHDVYPADNSTPLEFTVFNDELYFRACGVNGCELFKTDGNALTEFDINPFGGSDASG